MTTACSPTTTSSELPSASGLASTRAAVERRGEVDVEEREVDRRVVDEQLHVLEDGAALELDLARGVAPSMTWWLVAMVPSRSIEEARAAALGARPSLDADGDHRGATPP